MNYSKFYFSVLFSIYILTSIKAQNTDSIRFQDKNTSTYLLQKTEGKVNIAAYGELSYSKTNYNNIKRNAVLDVGRIVMMMGYNFNSKTSLISELEFEHVSEIFVEQAYIQHKVDPRLNLKAGLLLIPIGIVNEFHEPTTFFGVERPIIDKVIVPTTWREIGIGASGNFIDAHLNYQVYLINGLLGHDGTNSKINASNGYRSGRQKGAVSTMSSPNISAKINYYGIKGLKLGLSGYLGKTQSKLYDNIDPANELLNNKADSSVLDLRMLGLDAKYEYKGLKLVGQLIYSKNKNSEKYNAFGKSDIGSEVYGYYIQMAYNLFQNSDNNPLHIFARYDKYNTQYKLDKQVKENNKSAIQELTFGIDYTLSDGVAIKLDYQINKNLITKKQENQLNLGLGFWFK